MKKILVLLLTGTLTISSLMADDGEYDLEYNNNRSQSINLEGNSEHKAQLYKKYANSINDTQNVNSATPSNVRKVINEINNIKITLKSEYSNLSQAYESGNSKQAKTIELKVWETKKKIEVLEKKKTFEYQIYELHKVWNKFPKSEDMKKLIIAANKNVKEFVINANKIIKLEAEENALIERLSKMQKVAKIIHQKEVLNKMQQEYNINN